MVMTMEFISKDDWDAPVYKCEETGVLWKDINLGKGEPALYRSSNNEMDGEPDSAIRDDVEVVFKTKYEESPYRHNYMMLGRLQSDCEYYLGFGNRHEGHLWAGSVDAQIAEMKKLHDSFPDGHKPEWLTYEQLLNYETQMKGDLVNDK